MAAGHHGDAAVPRHLFHSRRRAGSRASRSIGLASLFLLYSAGKSSLTLCFAVLLLTSLTSVVRSFWLRAVMLLTPLRAAEHAERRHRDERYALPRSPSCCRWTRAFTGRTDIWNFALQSLQPRLATGYGFASFWGSSAIQNLPEGKEWAAYAAHSHNGYLDTALGMGLPGLALLIARDRDRAAARFSRAPTWAATTAR